MDVGAAAKTCRIPDCGMFCGLLGMAVVPVLAGFSMYVGIWYLATRVGIDAVSQARAEAQDALAEEDLDAVEAALGRLDRQACEPNPAGRHTEHRHRRTCCRHASIV